METLEVFENCLEQEIRAYEGFLARLPLKLALMRRAQVAPLQALIAREESDRRTLLELEARRKEAAARLAARTGLPEDASLRVFAARIGGEGARRLLDLRERWNSVIVRLQAGQETLGMLTQASLDYVGFSLGLFSKALNPEAQLADMTYGGVPGGVGRAASSLLDRTA